MTYLYPYRRVIDLTATMRHAHKSGCDISAETVDSLMEQIARDRAAMREEIARLRKQFSLDLAEVAAKLRETKQELECLRIINQFANSELRDLSQALH